MYPSRIYLPTGNKIYIHYFCFFLQPSTNVYIHVVSALSDVDFNLWCWCLNPPRGQNTLHRLFCFPPCKTFTPLSNLILLESFSSGERGIVFPIFFLVGQNTCTCTHSQLVTGCQDTHLGVLSPTLLINQHGLTHVSSFVLLMLARWRQDTTLWLIDPEGKRYYVIGNMFPIHYKTRLSYIIQLRWCSKPRGWGVKLACEPWAQYKLIYVSCSYLNKRYSQNI